MPPCKQLANILRKAGIDEKNVDKQLEQRAAYNMTNYLRLINFRLDQPSTTAESQHEQIANLLHFIHARG